MLKGFGERPACLRLRHWLPYVATITLLQIRLFAQITDVTSVQSPPIPAAGHGYIQMLDETVNPSNGALSIRINVQVPPGRHLSVPFGFAYDSNAANFINYQDSLGNSAYLSGGGWSYLLPHIALQHKDLSYFEQYRNGAPVQSTKYPCDLYNDYIFADPGGGTHALYLATWGNLAGCQGGFSMSTPTYTTGGDGRVTATATGGNNGAYGQPITISDATGTVYYFSSTPHQAPTSPNSLTILPSWIENSNGDKVAINDLGSGSFNMVDTLGRTVIASSGFGQTGNMVAVSGISLPYELTWGTASSTWTPNTSIVSDCVLSGLSGCGGCSPIVGNGLPASGIPVISAIELPNTTSYQFTYDSKYGLVNKIIYPSGGYVRYVWGVNSLSDAIDFYPDSKGNFACHERFDTVAVLNRYVSADGIPTHEYQEQDYSYSPTTWITTSGSGTPGYQVWNASDKSTTIVAKDNLLGSSTQTLYSYAPLSLTPNPLDGYSKFTFSGNCASLCTTDGIVWSQPVYREYPVEQVTTFEDGSGKVLKTLTQSFADQFRMNCAVTDLDNVAISGKYYTWGAGDQITDTKEYDFGLISNPTTCESNSLPSATPTRETAIAYSAFSTTPVGGTILDRPNKVQVYGGGALAAETDYVYDVYGSSGIIPVSATGHDDTNFPATYTNRGNVTSKTIKCFAGANSCTNAVSSYGYDQTGQIISKTDPLSYVTSYSYADNSTNNSVCLEGASNPAGNSNAYLTQIKDPLLHTQKFSYNYAKGELTCATDQNSQSTGYSYDDPLDRLTNTTYPDQGSVTLAYNDAIPSVTMTKVQTPNPTVTGVSIMDGLGRVIETQKSDPNGADVVNTVYDGMGNTYTETNSFLSSSQPSSTFVSTPGGTPLTTQIYDALSRPIETVEQDGSTLQWCYDGVASSTLKVYCSPTHLGSITNGAWVDSTDENGNHWQRTSDSFGRLLDVVEPNGTSQTASMETDYGYDALNNLLSVNQKGNGAISTARVRSFNYDSLSRLLCASNPENSYASCPASYSAYVSGTTGYIYDADGNLSSKIAPAPNQTGTSTTVASFTYDALNRLSSKSISAGITPISCYGYDTVANGIGRLSNAWTQPAGTTCTGSGGTYAPVAGQFIALKSILSYDPMGRPKSAQQQHCIGSKCSAASPYSLTIGYDLAGNVQTLTNSVGAQGSPLTLTNYLDSANRLCLTTSSWSSGFSPNLFQTNPSTSTPGYAPFGGLANWYLGSNSSSALTSCTAAPSSQMNLQQGFDNRLRVTSFSSSGQVP